MESGTCSAAFKFGMSFFVEEFEKFVDVFLPIEALEVCGGGCGKFGLEGFGGEDFGDLVGEILGVFGVCVEAAGGANFA